MRAVPKPRREQDPEYVCWVKTQPEWRCIITDRAESVACHLTSVGARGSDYWVFPLIQELHDESHRKPEFFYRYRKALAQWYYTLPILHERYRRRQEPGPQRQRSETDRAGPAATR